MAQLNDLLVTGSSRFLNPIHGNAQNGIYQVIGTQTASTGAWTGNIPVPALYDGLTIMYYLPYNGSGNATLNLTLSDGTTTGAINCYYNQNDRLTTHYRSGNNVVMTYHSAGSIKINGTATTDNRWIVSANYTDGNDTSYYDRMVYVGAKAGSNKVFPYTLLMRLPDGRWESIVTSSSTGTGKARNTHGFLFGQLTYMNYNDTYNENDVIGTYHLWSRYTNLVDYRYFINITSSAGLTANSRVYLVGSISSDGLFYLDANWWTQTLPSSADGKIYIYIGDVYDWYRATFYGTGNMQAYVYTNGHLREYHQESATVGGHTVAKDVPSNANFSNTTYTFANGTNGFTVTPSGGSAQTVTVTPSISNNVTGSGTSGYLTKFNGANTITNGPALGSDTTKFLRNDGSWAVPPGTSSGGNKIFIVEPTPPYSVGDLWIVDDNNISVCGTARASGSFNSDDWGSAVDAIDSESVQTNISSAISNSINVVTGAGPNGGNIILRLNDTTNAPYELLVTDTPTDITASNAKIYRWDGSGLRFSETGYNGTYSTLINSSGQIPAQYLTGNLNASLVAIQNFTATMVHGGVLTRGRTNNQDGTIEVYDANGTIIAEVSNLGLKIYGQGAGNDRPYYLINASGFVGYTKINNTWTPTVKVAFDEFRMSKAYVGEELNIGNKIKIVPQTTSTNNGIAFVAVPST